MHYHNTSRITLRFSSVQDQSRRRQKSRIDDFTIDEIASSKFIRPHVSLDRHCSFNGAGAAQSVRSLGESTETSRILALEPPACPSPQLHADCGLQARAATALWWG
jgi:hypothetical protein